MAGMANNTAWTRTPGRPLSTMNCAAVIMMNLNDVTKAFWSPNVCLDTVHWCLSTGITFSCLNYQVIDIYAVMKTGLLEPSPQLSWWRCGICHRSDGRCHRRMSYDRWLPPNHSSFPPVIVQSSFFFFFCLVTPKMYVGLRWLLYFFVITITIYTVDTIVIQSFQSAVLQ